MNIYLRHIYHHISSPTYYNHIIYPTSSCDVFSTCIFYLQHFSNMYAITMIFFQHSTCQSKEMTMKTSYNAQAYYVHAKAKRTKVESSHICEWVVSPNWILRNERKFAPVWLFPRRNFKFAYLPPHCALNARQAFGLLSPQPWNGKLV